jgi:hypothetical protein
MADASTAVTVLAGLSYPVTFALFAGQVPTARAIARAGGHAAEQYSVLPTLATLGNCLLWASYGAYVGSSNVLGVNAGGAAFNVGYAAVFWTYSGVKARVRLATLLTLLVVAVAAVDAAVFAVRPSSGAVVLASLSIAVNIAMFASPVGSVLAAVRSLDASRVPVAMNVAAAACSGLWTALGVLQGDFFIAGPNIAGLVMTALQLAALGYVVAARRAGASAIGAAKRNASRLSLVQLGAEAAAAAGSDTAPDAAASAAAGGSAGSSVSAMRGSASTTQLLGGGGASSVSLPHLGGGDSDDDAAHGGAARGHHGGGDSELGLSMDDDGHHPNHHHQQPVAAQAPIVATLTIPAPASVGDCTASAAAQPAA